MNGDPVLEARSLVVRYGRNDAVRGIDLAVRRGEVVGLIGPDGAGKTSVLRVLGGLKRSEGGEARAFGEGCWATRRRLHRRLGYLAQRFALYSDLSVDENIRFFALLYGVAGWRARRDDLLNLVDLAPFRDRRAGALSGGMKQKLALTCSLIHGPEVLLLDEPTTGVDPVTRREFWRLLARLVEGGLTLVVATPYLDEAERCSRVVLMHQGAVLVEGPPRSIPERIPGVLLAVDVSPRRLVARALGKVAAVREVTPFGPSFHVLCDETGDPESLVRQALVSAGAATADVRRIPKSLEDSFLILTRERKRPLAGES